MSAGNLTTIHGDPAQGCRKVHRQVGGLDEHGHQHFKVRLSGVLVVTTFFDGMMLGAQQGQQLCVATKDVDGVQATIKAVQLQKGPVTVALLVQARSIP